MSAPQKTAHEIQVEQLSQLVAKLSAEQKAKESAIKNLNDELHLAEADSRRKILMAEEAHKKRLMELQAILAPLESQIHVANALKADIAQLKQQKSEAESAYKSAHGLALKTANEQQLIAANRLKAIHEAIAACQGAVARI